MMDNNVLFENYQLSAMFRNVISDKVSNTYKEKNSHNIPETTARKTFAKFQCGFDFVQVCWGLSYSNIRPKALTQGKCSHCILPVEIFVKSHTILETPVGIPFA
jgi:hypothetical protein